ncbi:MAG TPA: hypothetical protein VGB26_04455 [Nitrospiria bacterium]|jgi:NADH:ubiquinone oxidoreductase subunit 3 (subunit A)
MKKEFDFFDHPGNIKRIKRIFYLVLILLLVFEFFIHKHTTFPWESIPGFNALYGFLACVVIVFFSNALGYFLKKKEGYYD